MKNLIPLASIYLLLILSGCKKAFYVSPDECQSLCYTFSGSVFDASTGLPIEFAKVELDLKRGSRSAIYEVLTGSLGDYAINVSDSIVQKGYEKGFIRYEKEHYLDKENAIDLKSVSIGEEVSDIVGLESSGSVSVTVIIKKQSARRVKLTLKGATLDLESGDSFSQPTPQFISRNYFPVPINQDNLLTIEYSDAEHDSIVPGSWQMVAGFPQTINVDFEERKQMTIVIE